MSVSVSLFYDPRLETHIVNFFSTDFDSKYSSDILEPSVKKSLEVLRGSRAACIGLMRLSSW